MGDDVKEELGWAEGIVLRMTVDNGERPRKAFCAAKINCRGEPNMSMNDGMRIIVEEIPALPKICRVVKESEAWNAVNPPAEISYFLVIVAGPIFVNEKVKLYGAAVNVTIKVHDKRLSAASIHRANNVEDSDGARRLHQTTFLGGATDKTTPCTFI